jgi:NAD(P)-dependent dehydrogenase (short-subunit alcohol dehydrogenase family)
MKSMEVNAVGNILVASRMLPCLIAAGDGRGGSNGSNGSGGPAVLANMSARVSSISDNGLGGWYSYRSSKTALNQLTKTLAVEMSRKKHNVSCVLLHPGTCDSDLSRWVSNSTETCAPHAPPWLSHSLALSLALRVCSFVLSFVRPWHNNVPDGKLFSKERGVRQLLEIIEGASLEDSGTLIAWDKRKIEW